MLRSELAFAFIISATVIVTSKTAVMGQCPGKINGNLVGGCTDEENLLDKTTGIPKPLRGEPYQIVSAQSRQNDGIFMINKNPDQPGVINAGGRFLQPNAQEKQASIFQWYDVPAPPTGRVELQSSQPLESVVITCNASGDVIAETGVNGAGQGFVFETLASVKSLSEKTVTTYGDIMDTDGVKKRFDNNLVRFRVCNDDPSTGQQTTTTTDQLTLHDGSQENSKFDQRKIDNAIYRYLAAFGDGTVRIIDIADDAKGLNWAYPHPATLFRLVPLTKIPI